MAGYEKLTFKRFTEKLQAGEYSVLAGAKRAIGRSEMRDSEKATAVKAAEQYFEARETQKPTPEKKASGKSRKAAEEAPPPSAVSRSQVAIDAASRSLQGIGALGNAPLSTETRDMVAAVQTRGVQMLNRALGDVHQYLYPVQAPATEPEKG